MLKREWGAESNGKLPHLFILSKTATQVPEFAMEDLPLGSITALMPEFAVKDLPLSRTLMIIIYIYIHTHYMNDIDIIMCVPMPTHCTITCFGFHARWIDGGKCGLFSNHAPLGQTTLCVG